jgi:sulfane dehydrogenase subunit SoxC
MTRDETSKYTDLRSDGRATLFTFPMGVKSVITNPSGGQQVNKQGIYQINGLAWSGSGRIRRVEVSADGGKSWAEASLDGPVQERHLTRFRAALHWQGQPTTLLSRATDDTGAIQPTRDAVVAGRASGAFYHVNAIQAWHIAESGAVTNVYV